MYNTKLCISTNTQFGLTVEEQIRLFKKAGFDGFFTMWDENLMTYRKIADEEGLLYQSVHSNFLNAEQMWEEDAVSKDAVDELLTCVRDSAEAGVGIVVVHPYKGFEPKIRSFNAGVDNFGKVVEEAKKLNVKIAFENVEGEEYLEALMNAFESYENVGFCWDSGHELCYNRGKDMLSVYGDRLIATHLNDNLGVSDFNGKIFFTDDLHLLPFDGITDWKGVANRLNNCGYNGELTFELNTKSKPGRHENDKYENVPIEQYIAECYARACRVAYMKNGLISL